MDENFDLWHIPTTLVKDENDDLSQISTTF
jgi:hypothetical protein